MNYIPVINLVNLLYKLGLRQVVLSPGSRNAPLTLSFVRHGGFEILSAGDERSAAYMALGKSLATGTPAIVCCTSGTAAANFLPAIAEASLQEIPLIAITADRPLEWIGQQDGQAMKQNNLFSDFVRGFWQMPADFTHGDSLWFLNRAINEAYLSAMGPVKGPVHINFPFREPFYPEAHEVLDFSQEVRVIERVSPTPKLTRNQMHPFQKEWESFEKKMIVVGQMPFNEDLNNALKALCEYDDVVVLADGPANVFKSGVVLTLSEIMAKGAVNDYEPDILITLGLSVLSKPLKSLLREFKPDNHWHIQSHSTLADPFQSLTKLIVAEPASFIQALGENAFFGGEKPKPFRYLWNQAQEKAKAQRDLTLSENNCLNDAYVCEVLIKSLPEGSKIHVANSMPVRYLNLFQDLLQEKHIEVLSNRGVSGIDGCISTAFGYALNSDSPNYLLVGDMAFFYDKNGFWADKQPKNLKVVVLNNGGGNIFRMIPGPKAQPELEPYFETNQTYNLSEVSKAMGIKAQCVSEIKELEKGLNWLNKTDGPSVLEIYTDKVLNAQVFHTITKPL